jgi:integrase
MPPLVTNALKDWKLRCPQGALRLAFPNAKGNVASYNILVRAALIPPQITAGVTVAAVDCEGKHVVAANYTGMHALRHFYAQ